MREAAERTFAAASGQVGGAAFARSEPAGAGALSTESGVVEDAGDDAVDKAFFDD